MVGLRAEHQEHTVGNLIGPGQVGEERPRGTQLAVDMVQPVNEDDRPAPAGSVFLSEEGKLSVEPIEQQFALARQVGSLGRDAGLLKGQAYILEEVHRLSARCRRVLGIGDVSVVADDPLRSGAT